MADTEKVPNEIIMFFHCAQCIEEKPDDESPRSWGRLEAGWTKAGFQIWCKRHEINILHVNFQGQQHPATMAREVHEDGIVDGKFDWS